MDCDCRNDDAFRRHYRCDLIQGVEPRFGVFNPTQATIRDKHGSVFEWGSRDHRKGRYPRLHFSHHKHPRPPPLYLLPIWPTYDFKDISYWVAFIFTLGCVAWVINGHYALWPLGAAAPSKAAAAAVSAIAAAVGGTLFEIGSWLLYWEALNTEPDITTGVQLDPNSSNSSSNGSQGDTLGTGSAACLHHASSSMPAACSLGTPGEGLHNSPWGPEGGGYQGTTPFSHAQAAVTAAAPPPPAAAAPAAAPAAPPAVRGLSPAAGGQGPSGRGATAEDPEVGAMSHSYQHQQQQQKGQQGVLMHWSFHRPRHSLHPHSRGRRLALAHHQKGHLTHRSSSHRSSTQDAAKQAGVQLVPAAERPRMHQSSSKAGQQQAAGASNGNAVDSHDQRAAQLALAAVDTQPLSSSSANSHAGLTAVPRSGSNTSLSSTSSSSSTSKVKPPWRWWGWRGRDIGFTASFLQLIGATIFWVPCIFGIPNVTQPEDESNYHLWNGVYWLLQVIGATFFILSSLLFMMEVQKAWYRPALLSVGWHVGWWNLVGSVGFWLSGFFGLWAVPSGKYQVGGTVVSTLWGSWAFLLGSYLQLLEAVNKQGIAVAPCIRA